jgi:mannose-6-phosphate isomerase-like protein (cupin superfamily)
MIAAPGLGASGNLNPPESPEHGHDKDERYMVISGEMTITQDGKANIMRGRDVDVAGPNDRHAGRVGPQGVAWIFGRRAARS